MAAPCHPMAPAEKANGWLSSVFGTHPYKFWACILEANLLKDLTLAGFEDDSDPKEKEEVAKEVN